MRRFFSIGIVLFMILLAACSKDPVKSPSDLFDTPLDLDDGWEVSCPFDEGMDVNQLISLSNHIHQGDFGQMTSLLVARHGSLIFERYYNDFQRQELHHVRSVTKSVVASIFGIVMAEAGLSVEDTLMHHIHSRYHALFKDVPEKKNILLKHVLTMTSGLAWDEIQIPYGDPANSYTAMHNSTDFVRYTLEQELIHEPGTVFEYSSGGSHLLSHAIFQATGRHLDDLAREFLFEPLQIESFNWAREPGNERLFFGGSGLELRPRDMAKLGQLYLSQGRWQGEQIIPADWVEAAHTFEIEGWPNFEYGYQWWNCPWTRHSNNQIEEFDMPFAWGWGGQHIFIIPVYDIVVVITAENGQAGTPFISLLFDYIFPAITQS